MYRVGWPFARQLNRLGVPVVIVLDIIHDREAGVLVAVSKDVPGLVVEAASLDEVVREARDLIPELIGARCVDIPHTRLSLNEPLTC